MPWTHRLYCPDAREGAERVDLSAEQAHYISRVLRMDSGAAIKLFDGRGGEYIASIEGRGRRKVSVAGLQKVDAMPESPLQVTLYQGIARGERMDWVMQKATELGVAAIRPVFAERTEVKLKADRLKRRMLHWEGVVASACEQCGRAWLPKLLDPVPLYDLHVDAEPDRLRLVGSIEKTARLLPSFDAPRAVDLVIGPEGGLTYQEEKFLVDAGWQAASVGPRVLRTETAGPAALAIMQALWGDGAP
ncbi:MAG: 16S rRNA (uracil(1498)-N(3))-methyltransferase [Pseudomonadota bacterium]